MDVLGLVIAVVVLAASAHENTAGIALLGRVAASTEGTVTKALADQGFKNAVVAHGAGLGIDVEIVERNPADKGFVPQPKRCVVEQTYGILMFHRRLVRDVEHLPASSESSARALDAYQESLAPPRRPEAPRSYGPVGEAAWIGEFCLLLPTLRERAEKVGLTSELEGLMTAAQHGHEAGADFAELLKRLDERYGTGDRGLDGLYGGYPIMDPVYVCPIGRCARTQTRETDGPAPRCHVGRNMRMRGS
ncbi:hypothetical protein Acor_60190 [Acrocarpospora corrugata]|uniref:Transposase IS4-like domain-containing protein n=1 Tax=Acrocarpospora corrugata TaxID=35763 RepID=A0A5M3W9U6_9ACTN|nr:hypothetical protein [Acrocarpospora corrugata]GES03953.1 hypothetical protein Acor_60190 [Acrocarpospora corrugata]